jgi:hypothetical protein
VTFTLTIPDVLTRSLGSEPEDVRRAVIEGFAVESYRSGSLSSAEIRELLGHSSRWQTEDFLAQHGAWPDPSEAEVEEDLRNLAALHAA